MTLETSIPFEITHQPDEETCGPSCLHALYRYYGDAMPLERIIREVPSVEGGGTIAVLLANHALKRGYRATIYTYNLLVFDPTWFQPGATDIRDRLRAQIAAKDNDKIRFASEAYIEFVERGGVLRFEDLQGRLIRRYLNRHHPIITGLSATYLYRSMREYGEAMKPDDARGEPSGHFVVLCGYDRGQRVVQIADPYARNPVAGPESYMVNINRVMGAIMLGVITFDANLLIIRPRDKRDAPHT